MVNQYRSAIESIYSGSCDIYEYIPSKDPVTKITGLQDNLVAAGQPCRLSFQTISPSDQSDSANEIRQTIKLFMSPAVLVKAGSKLIVTQNGRTETYRNTGKAAVYSNHQELVLNLYEERA